MSVYLYIVKGNFFKNKKKKGTFKFQLNLVTRIRLNFLINFYLAYYYYCFFSKQPNINQSTEFVNFFQNRIKSI